MKYRKFSLTLFYTWFCLQISAAIHHSQLSPSLSRPRSKYHSDVYDNSIGSSFSYFVKQSPIRRRDTVNNADSITSHSPQKQKPIIRIVRGEKRSSTVNENGVSRNDDLTAPIYPETESYLRVLSRFTHPTPTEYRASPNFFKIPGKTDTNYRFKDNLTHFDAKKVTKKINQNRLNLPKVLKKSDNGDFSSNNRRPGNSLPNGIFDSLRGTGFQFHQQKYKLPLLNNQKTRKRNVNPRNFRNTPNRVSVDPPSSISLSDFTFDKIIPGPLKFTQMELQRKFVDISDEDSNDHNLGNKGKQFLSNEPANIVKVEPSIIHQLGESYIERLQPVVVIPRVKSQDRPIEPKRSSTKVSKNAYLPSAKRLTSIKDGNSDKNTIILKREKGIWSNYSGNKREKSNKEAKLKTVTEEDGFRPSYFGRSLDTSESHILEARDATAENWEKKRSGVFSPGILEGGFKPSYHFRQLRSIR